MTTDRSTLPARPGSGRLGRMGPSRPGRFGLCAIGAIAAATLTASSALAGDGHGSAADLSLAHLAQNPLADAISLPFSNEANFGLGPRHDTGNVLSIQPVIPFRLNDDWSLVTRVTIPVATQPRMAPGDSRSSGLGDLVPMFLFSPAHPGSVIWGVGPTLSLPTATDPKLGTGTWAVGPTAVVLVQPDPYVFGILASQWWGVGNPRPGAPMNRMAVQLFAVRNFDDGWYASYSPIITADWTATERDRWTVPVGAEIGRVFEAGGQAMAVSAGAYYNAIRPRDGSDWQARIGLSLIFPK